MIQKEMAAIFQEDGKSRFRGKMISVTTVRVTRDLGIARCYLSVFPSNDGEAVLKDIRKIAGMYRGALGKKIGKEVRGIPEFEFFLDDSLDYIDNIDHLLND